MLVHVVFFHAGVFLRGWVTQCCLEAQKRLSQAVQGSFPFPLGPPFPPLESSKFFCSRPGMCFWDDFRGGRPYIYYMFKRVRKLSQIIPPLAPQPFNKTCYGLLKMNWKPDSSQSESDRSGSLLPISSLGREGSRPGTQARIDPV